MPGEWVTFSIRVCASNRPKPAPARLSRTVSSQLARHPPAAPPSAIPHAQFLAARLALRQPQLGHVGASTNRTNPNTPASRREYHVVQPERAKHSSAVPAAPRGACLCLPNHVWRRRVPPLPAPRSVEREAGRDSNWPSRDCSSSLMPSVWNQASALTQTPSEGLARDR